MLWEKFAGVFMTVLCFVTIQSTTGQGWYNDRYRCPSTLPRSDILRTISDICYLFVRTEKTWVDARDYCRGYETTANTGHLVVIRAKGLQTRILEALTNLTWATNGVWIGLHDRHDEGSWEWVTGYKLAEGGLADWAPDQPGFVGPFEDCAQMRRDEDGQWHDFACDSALYKYSFICQYPMGPVTTTPSSTTSVTTSTTSSPSTNISTSSTSVSTPQPNTTTATNGTRTTTMTASNTTIPNTTSASGNTTTTEMQTTTTTQTTQAFAGATAPQTAAAAAAGLGTGGIIGVAIASALLLVAVIIVALIFCRRRRREKDAEDGKSFHNIVYHVREPRNRQQATNGPALEVRDNEANAQAQASRQARENTETESPYEEPVKIAGAFEKEANAETSIKGAEGTDNDEAVANPYAELDDILAAARLSKAEHAFENPTFFKGEQDGATPEQTHYHEVGEVLTSKGDVKAGTSQDQSHYNEVDESLTSQIELPTRDIPDGMSGYANMDRSDNTQEDNRGYITPRPQESHNVTDLKTTDDTMGYMTPRLRENSTDGGTGYANANEVDV